MQMQKDTSFQNLASKGRSPFVCPVSPRVLYFRQGFANFAVRHGPWIVSPAALVFTLERLKVS